MEADLVLDKVMTVLNAYGITPQNTLFAQSACPDEINHEPGDITNIFSSALGKAGNATAISLFRY